MQGLLIVGGGFAGMWAALAAARERALHGGQFPIRILSPDDHITMRPRLYEANPNGFRLPLAPTLDPVDVRLVDGAAVGIDARTGEVMARSSAGEFTLAHDRLVLATGSVVRRLPVPGLSTHGFDIDTWPAAVRLDEHLAETASEATDAARTFVIVGAGFTGVELATELRDRLAAHGGDAYATAARIILVDQASVVAPELGENPREAILTALKAAGVDLRLGTSVSYVTPDLVMLEDGHYFPCRTVVNAAGLAASPVAGLLGVDLDPDGRLPTDDLLRVPGVANVFAAGDIARARVDDAGHVALMSCQHSMRMGRAAGFNAARDLLGRDLHPYRQERYVTCLDLGRSGAVFTTGWNRQVEMTGADAKARKRMINQEVIYPPTGSREEILAAAAPDVPPGQPPAASAPAATARPAQSPDGGGSSATTDAPPPSGAGATPPQSP